MLLTMKTVVVWKMKAKMERPTGIKWRTADERKRCFHYTRQVQEIQRVARVTPSKNR